MRYLILILFLASVCFGAPVYIHVDAASAGGGNASTWGTGAGDANGAYNLADFKTLVEADVVAEDTYFFFKGGTYTLVAAITVHAGNDGTAALPIHVIGVKAATTNLGANIVASDWAYSSARPLFNAGANNTNFSGPQLWIYRNLIITGTSGGGFNRHNESFAVNCSFFNTSSAAGRVAVQNGYSVNCEMSSVKGYGQSTAGTAFNCYIHDCDIGLSGVVRATNCIIETCSTGITLTTTGGQYFNNTICNCTTGITGGTSNYDTFMNNIIGQSKTGASWTTDQGFNIWHHNLMNNDTDQSNATQSILGTNVLLAVATNPINSAIAKGTDGRTDGAGTTFEAATSTNVFTGVTAGSDYLLITEAGTGATLGVHSIAIVNDGNTLTLSATAGASKTGIDYGIVKGTNFTLSADGQTACLKAGAMLTTNDGLATAGFHQNIGFDQTGDFPAAASVIESDTTDGSTGTYHEAAVSEVLDSVSFGPASVYSGLYHAPAASEVINTAVFGISSATAGTWHVPERSEVWNGVIFGATTGTKRASSITNCEPNNIKLNVLIDDVNGTLSSGSSGGGWLCN